jgi:hypothetical protein
MMLSLDIMHHPMSARVTADFVRQVADWQESVLFTYGNNGYPIAKAPESYFKCLSSTKSGSTLPGRKSPAELMRDKFLAKERDLPEFSHRRPTIDRLVRLGDVLETADDCIEASGLLRQCGFPIVDPATSAHKSRVQGGRPDETNVSAAADVVRLFSHLILKEYVRKELRWPPIDFSASAPGTTLYRLHHDRRTDISDHSYNLTDWDHATIHDIATFNYVPDYLQLLADKACCAGRLSRIDHYRGRIDNAEQRRLLSTVLAMPHLDIREDVLNFAGDAMPYDYYAADLTPKECEYKPEARMYTILHPRIRNVLSTIQLNVKEIFFPYLPYTSMAMSASQVATKLHSMTAAHHGHKTLKLESDLSSWNLRFRTFLCEQVGYKMDRMCGVQNHFGKSHQFFARSEFCVTAKHMRVLNLEEPEIRLSHHCNDVMWYYDDSGKEGIEQRFWSVITAVMVYYVFYDEPYAFEILGQGDNQVIVVDFQSLSDEIISEETDRLTRKFERVMASLNHEAKPEEFIESMSMMTYSKDAYENGRRIATVAKFGSRVAPTSGELECSFSDMLGSVFSSALGAARNAPDSLDAWYLGLIVADEFTVDTLRGKTILDSGQELSGLANEDTRILALTTPPVLGGFPIVPFSGFLYGGDPDPLSHAISALKILSRFSGPHRAFEAYLMSDTAYRVTPPLESLLSDPFGLPFRIPALASQLVSDAALARMAASRNTHLSQVAQTSGAHATAVKACLSSVRPFNPVMMRDLYEMSTPGRADKLARKFTSTATLRSAVYTYGLRQEVSNAARRRERHIVLHLQAGQVAQGGGFGNQLSPAIATRLRQQRWGLSPHELSSISVAQPLDYTISGSIGDGVTAVITPHDPALPGPYLPYLGQRTHERRSAETYAVEDVPGIADLRKLVLSYTAGRVSTQLHAIYDAIARERSGYGISELVNIFPTTIGGIAEHRYDPLRGSNSISPMGNPSGSTWARMSTDAIPGLSASATDWPVPVQSLLAFMANAVQLKCLQQPSSRPIVMRLEFSIAGLDQLQDTSRHSSALYPLGRVHPNNPFLHVPDLTITQARSTVEGARAIVSASSPGDVVGLVTGVLVQGLLVANSAAPVDAIASARVTQDIASVAAVGALALVRAAERALAIAVAWFLMWHMAREDHRFHEPLLLDNLSLSLARILVPLLMPAEVRLDQIIRRGYWDEAAGPSGIRAAADHLRRALRRGGRAQLLAGVSSTTSQTIFPRLFPRVPTAFTTRLQLACATYDLAHAGAIGLVGACKRFSRAITARIREYTGSGAADDVMRLPSLAALVETIRSYADQDVSNETMVQLATVRIFDGDDVSAWRHLRRSSQPPPTQVRVEPMLNSDGVPVVYSPLSTASSESHISVPWTLGESSSRSRRDTILDRFGRTAGRRSTVAQVWASSLQGIREPVLVVGSGQGGIQAYLESLGVRSIGMDLFSTIPPERIADASYVPPDAWQGLASFSPVVIEEGGNWFDCGESAIARHAPATVVLDIEMGRTRVGLECLRPLLIQQFEGRVIFRLVATSEELDAFGSVLAGSHGVSNLAIRACARPVSSVAAPVIVSVLFNRAILSDNVRRCSFAPSSGAVVYPSARGSREDIVRLAVEMTTGRMFSCISIAEFARECRERVDHHRSGRGSVSGGLLLSAMRYYMLSSLLVEAVAASHDGADIREAYCNAVLTERPTWREHGLALGWHDPPLQYLLVHAGPRLISAQYEIRGPPSREYA